MLQDYQMNAVQRHEWQQCLHTVQAMDPASMPTLGQLSYDIWGLGACAQMRVCVRARIYAHTGLMMHRLFVGSPLFRKDMDDNIEDDDLRRLVLWEGVDAAALRKKVMQLWC